MRENDAGDDVEGAVAVTRPSRDEPIGGAAELDGGSKSPGCSHSPSTTQGMTDSQDDARRPETE